MKSSNIIPVERSGNSIHVVVTGQLELNTLKYYYIDVGARLAYIHTIF